MLVLALVAPLLYPGDHLQHGGLERFAQRLFEVARRRHGVVH
jgi:hypothetical protein